MDAASKPAALPPPYRMPEPKPPATVATMIVGQTAYVARSAIEVDCDWGVWIDPNARPEPQSARAPVKVSRDGDGYAVDLLYAFNNTILWERQPAHTSFDGKGFIPATKVS